MVKKQIITVFILILALLFASLLVGCGSDEGSSTDVLTPPQTESTSEPDITPVPTHNFIDVLSSDVKADFPKSLTFKLEVESDREITDIELRYKIKKVASVSVLTTIKPDFAPGRLVKTSWAWDTRKASLPPGAEVEYYWIVENQVGNRLETDTASLMFDDSRYNWRELEEGKVRLFWYHGDEAFGQELMEAAQAALDKLSRDTGAQLEKESKIYIYANSRDLRGALVYAQEWTGGVAFAEYGIVAIGISPNNLGWGKRTVAHELAHLVVHQVTSNPYSDLPTWLDEGLAMYAEGELSQDFYESLKRAISKDNLISVRSLISSFPADPLEARLAYAQSYSIAKFLIDTYGSDKMLGLLQVFRDGSSPDDALLKVYGFDSDGLDKLWRDSLDLGLGLKNGFQAGFLNLMFPLTPGYSPSCRA